MPPDGRPGFSAGLELRQEQKAQPRLYQTMDLLHMPILDLQGHLRQELVNNPFLELVEPGEAASEEDGAAEGEVDWEAMLLDEYVPGGRREEYEEADAFTPTVTATRSLGDHLHEQLNLLRLAERQVLIGEEIIGNIDREGFLSCAPDRIGKTVEARLGPGASVSRGEVEEVLARVQGFDPSGIAARDLGETLLLQLRDRGREGSLPWRIIRDHFDELADHRWHELAEAYGITPREAQEAADEIATLDPKPGLRYADSSESYVIPDLTVDRVDGRYVVSHNDRTLPRLRLSPIYRDVAADRARFEGENRTFISERLNSARWLIQAIEQRRRTMLRVMDFIVDRQGEFFEKGVERLRPLTLREVARHLDVHESTVSRVANEKYVQTPRGLYPLKFFFSGGYATDGGADVSARGVRAQIHKLVAEEDPKSPLNDNQIADRLRRDGVKIARRTVAKYRDQLGILSARMRKRL
ncbi:RNA polymerase factor sigma-54 [Candidatus Palauibacter sp.]|uniref:RNA polymerase factor sigma-54 n=1 Tax=Candidatus Palauibacter sp. TaxID=3101350 RepID=UPI003B019EDF